MELSEWREELAGVLGEHSVIGAHDPRQGAGQIIAETHVLCFSCGWMPTSGYADHLAAILARLLAEVRAEALREAASAARGMFDPPAAECADWADWLDARATNAHPTDFTLTCEDVGCVGGRTIQGRKYHYDGSVEDQWADCGRRADNCPEHPTDDHAGEAK